MYMATMGNNSFLLFNIEWNKLTTHTDPIMAKVIKDSSIDNPDKKKFYIYFQSDIHFATLPKTAGAKYNTRNIQI